MLTRTVLVLVVGSTLANAASQLAEFYKRLEAVTSEEDRSTILNDPKTAADFDFTKMNLAEEIPVLAGELDSSKPDLAFLAIGQLSGIAMLSGSPGVMEQLRTLAPMVWSHFHDSPFLQNKSVFAAIPWKGAVIRFLGLTHVPLTQEMQTQLIDSLNDPELTLNAAETLAEMNPLPVSVRKSLLLNMVNSAYNQGVIIQALGNARVSDPETIHAIVAALSYVNPEPDPQHIATDAVHQAAAFALGQIGAKDALPELRSLAQNLDEAPLTKEQAATAITRIGASK